MSVSTNIPVTSTVAPTQNALRTNTTALDQHGRLEPAVVPPQRSPGPERLTTSKRTQQLMSMQLLTEKHVSAITAVPMGTLRRWRCVGDGPPFIKMGSGPKARVRYDAIDILAYVEAGKRYPIRAGNTGGQHGNY
jgi:hypothetical protein